MSKFSVSSAFFALGFASFLFACSDNKEPGPADLCKNEPSNACLVGEWRFDGIAEDEHTICSGTLIIYERRYSFSGKWDNYEIGGSGDWSLDGAKIRIDCDVGDCDDGYTRSGTVTVSADGMTMRIRNDASKAAISWYESRVPNPTEKFTRIK